MTHKTALRLAQVNQRDEYYTRLCDVESELQHYSQFFIGKVIYCPCDNPLESNFYRYFFDNFKALKLKRLIATNYAEQKGDLFNEVEEVAPHYADYDGETLLFDKIEGNGDFRNRANIELFKQADIIVTNPPFSLYREFLLQVLKYNKDYILLGNLNALAYKDFRHLTVSGEMKVGFSTMADSTKRWFKIPNHYTHGITDARVINGERCAKASMTTWYTNLPIERQYDNTDLVAKYDTTMHEQYDNHEAINVDRCEDIPTDYDGLMGVPITFIYRLDPTEYKLVEIFSKAMIDGRLLYKRLIIKRIK